MAAVGVSRLWDTDALVEVQGIAVSGQPVERRLVRQRAANRHIAVPCPTGPDRAGPSVNLKAAQCVPLRGIPVIPADLLAARRPRAEGLGTV